MPTAAEALCKIQVNAAPTRKPKTGLEKDVSKSTNAGISFNGATAPLMAPMPNISTAKPIIMSPMCLWVARLAAVRTTIPAMAISPVRVDVDRSETQPLPPLMSDRQMTQPVTLVPRIAPKIMPVACSNFIMPELTKPTTMTDVADEDWMTAVTPVPNRMPFSFVLVSL